MTGAGSRRHGAGRALSVHSPQPILREPRLAGLLPSRYFNGNLQPILRNPMPVSFLPRGREIRRWLCSLLILAPATPPYVFHFLADDGKMPTGFIQGDQQHYMAIAREHFDNGEFTLLYGNPFSPFFDTPRIYFQPQTLLLGLLHKGTQCDPGVLYVIFGFFAAWTCCRIGMALYEDVVGLSSSSHWIGLVVFFWGGGLLVLCGFAISTYYVAYGGSYSIRNIFQLDPMGGWWFLNLGRNLVLPTEAFYHSLFFAVVLCLRKRRFALASALTLVLAIAHPYTGSELLAILFVWSFLEMSLHKQRNVPIPFFIACCGMMVLHLLYYLVYLPGFPEHRSLMLQWEQPWYLRAETMLPAYSLVGAATLWNFRRIALLRQFLAESRNRLLAAWCLVAVLLSNHDLFMHPIQPLHFDRGYVWSSLFLVGSPTLLAIVNRLRKPGLMKRVGLVCLILLFLSDNATWFATVRLTSAVRLSADQKAVLVWMNDEGNRGALLVSQDNTMGDLSTVYTPVRTWFAHTGLTPFEGTRTEEVKKFFSEGKIVDTWKSRRLIVLFSQQHASPSDSRPTIPALEPMHLTRQYSNAGYSALVFDP